MKTSDGELKCTRPTETGNGQCYPKFLRWNRYYCWGKSDVFSNTASMEQVLVLPNTATMEQVLVLGKE